MVSGTSPALLRSAANAAWEFSASVQQDAPLPREVWAEGWMACAEHLRLEELNQALTKGVGDPSWARELQGQLLRLGVPAPVAQAVAARVCQRGA